MKEINYLDLLHVWFDAKRTFLRSRSVDAEVELSERDGEAIAIRVILESKAKMGEIIVWDNGMAELQLGSVVTGEVTTKSQSLSSGGELQSYEEQLLGWMLDD